MLNHPKLPFSPPFYTEEESLALRECIERRWTGTGPKTLEFEQKFCDYKSTAYSAAFSSCTSALFLALKSLGIGPGDEVITSAMTFCSTVNVIIHCGATPVLCDVDPISKNICPNRMAELVTPRTKAFVVVHYAGYPCDMDSIMALADQYHIHVIEDCAHAIEAKYKGRHCGTFGEVGCFSFYATKNIAIGEGGMAISSHQSLINKMSTLGLHGLSRDAWRRFESSKRKQYDVIDLGYKMNLTDLQSSVGLVQLSRLEEMTAVRQSLWNFYTSELSSTPLILPSLPTDDGSVHALHLFACGLPSSIDRDEFVWRASQEYNITLGVHYNSIPTFSAYNTYEFSSNPSYDYPVAYSWGKSTISLSLSAAVTHTDAERIVGCITQLLKSY